MSINQREFSTPSDTCGMQADTLAQLNNLSNLRATLMERLYRGIGSKVSASSIEHQANQIKRVWRSIDQIGGAS